MAGGGARPAAARASGAGPPVACRSSSSRREWSCWRASSRLLGEDALQRHQPPAERQQAAAQCHQGAGQEPGAAFSGRREGDGGKRVPTAGGWLSRALSVPPRLVTMAWLTDSPMPVLLGARGDEGLEEARQHLGRHPRAGVTAPPPAPRPPGSVRVATRSTLRAASCSDMACTALSIRLRNTCPSRASSASTERHGLEVLLQPGAVAQLVADQLQACPPAPDARSPVARCRGGSRASRRRSWTMRLQPLGALQRLAQRVEHLVDLLRGVTCSLPVRSACAAGRSPRGQTRGWPSGRPAGCSSGGPRAAASWPSADMRSASSRLASSCLRAVTSLANTRMTPMSCRCETISSQSRPLRAPGAAPRRAVMPGRVQRGLHQRVARARATADPGRRGARPGWRSAEPPSCSSSSIGSGCSSGKEASRYSSASSVCCPVTSRTSRARPGPSAPDEGRSTTSAAYTRAPPFTSRPQL